MSFLQKKIVKGMHTGNSQFANIVETVLITNSIFFVTHVIRFTTTLEKRYINVYATAHN